MGSRTYYRRSCSEHHVQIVDNRRPFGRGVVLLGCSMPQQSRYAWKRDSLMVPWGMRANGWSLR